MQREGRVRLGLGVDEGSGALQRGPLSRHLKLSSQADLGAMWAGAIGHEDTLRAVHPGKLRILAPSQDCWSGAAYSLCGASSWGLSAQVAHPGRGPRSKRQHLPCFSGSCALLADSALICPFLEASSRLRAGGKQCVCGQVPLVS